MMSDALVRLGICRRRCVVLGVLVLAAFAFAMWSYRARLYTTDIAISLEYARDWPTPPPHTPFTLPPHESLETDFARRMFTEREFDTVTDEKTFWEHVEGASRLVKKIGERRYYTGYWDDPLDHASPRHIPRPIPFVQEVLRAYLNGTWIHLAGCSTTWLISDVMAKLLCDITSGSPFKPKRPTGVYDREYRACLELQERGQMIECVRLIQTDARIIEARDVDVADITREEARRLLETLAITADTNPLEHLCTLGRTSESPSCPDGALDALRNVRIRRGNVRVMLSVNWKETSYDDPYDRNPVELAMQDLGMDRPPDVFMANAGIHEFHNGSTSDSMFTWGVFPKGGLKRFVKGLDEYVKAMSRTDIPSKRADNVPRGGRVDAINKDVCVVWKGMNDYGFSDEGPLAPRTALLYKGRAVFRVMSRLAMELMGSRGAIVLDPTAFTEHDVVEDQFHHLLWSTSVIASELLLSIMFHACGVFGGIGRLPDIAKPFALAHWMPGVGVGYKLKH